jgi:hypothetical protein
VEQGSRPEPVNAKPPEPFVTRTADGKHEFSIDTSGAPDLEDWARSRLAPVLAEWYPKLAAMLPSEGFDPPESFRLTIRPGRGVAGTSGTRITANSDWIRRELEGEAIGALIHEAIHVIQQYGGGRRGDPGARRPPGWLVEGIPDYLRWFKFEPQSHGADLVWLRARRNLELKHDAGYRVSANFLNYVVERHDPDQKLIAELNAACRQGRYTDDLWKGWTGKSLEELSRAWKSDVEKQLASSPE